MQPLSHVAKTNQIALGSSAHFDKQPALAMLAMKVIAAAVTIDSAFARIFVLLMRSEPEVGSAMYLSVSADNTRDAMLRAAADVVLSPRDNELFTAVRAVATTVLKLRHKLAHWTWGSSPDVSDALLICNPKDYMPLNVACADIAKRFNTSEASDFGASISELPKLSHDKIFVVKDADLIAGSRPSFAPKS
jgi:hypothetical protein